MDMKEVDKEQIAAENGKTFKSILFDIQVILSVTLLKTTRFTISTT